MLLLALLLCQDPVGALVDRAVADTKIDGKIAVSLWSVQAGKLLHQRGADEALVLASNTKLLTTAAALARLGPDFKFRTVLGLEGGALHVFGGGDPNISGRFHEDDPTAVFKGWAKKLAEAKIAKVDALVLHAGLFDRVALHSDWIALKYDQDAWWCAPVGALSLNDNCVDVLYEAAGEGEPAKITLRPDTKHVSVTNASRTVKEPDAKKPFIIERKDGTNEIIVRGELKAGTKRMTKWIAIRDPARYFGTVLKETLERAGVEVGEIRESDTALGDHPKLQTVAEHETDLAATLKVCNTVSQNFYAEMICKTLGVKRKGQGTTAAGVEAIREFLEKDVGIKVEQADGSGLSRGNRASAASLHALLEYMRRHAHAKVWVDSLPVNGTDPGTLRRRMLTFRGAVHAKTGHISGVAALSGYLTTNAGDTLVFSILNNEWKSGSADRFQDRLLELLVAHKGD